jgi:hypothetical protein
MAISHVDPRTFAEQPQPSSPLQQPTYSDYIGNSEHADLYQENAISYLTWYPPSGILLVAWKAPKPFRIILQCSNALQAVPGASMNFPQSYRSISQQSYHFLQGPPTCTFLYSALHASLMLGSPHCQLVSYVTPFVDHAVNSSILPQTSS